jgi:hypothetical protein
MCMRPGSFAVTFAIHPTEQLIAAYGRAHMHAVATYVMLRARWVYLGF